MTSGLLVHTLWSYHVSLKCCREPDEHIKNREPSLMHVQSERREAERKEESKES